MKLNIGAGAYPLEGFINLDLPDFDIAQPWKFANKSVDYIQLSHVLEHVTREQAQFVIREAYRVLNRGGVLHIAVPDMDKFIDCHLSGDFTPLEGYGHRSLDNLMGGGEDESRPEYRHRYMYSYASLWYYLFEEFDDIDRVEANEYDNPDYYAISLYVEAQK